MTPEELQRVLQTDNGPRRDVDHGEGLGTFALLLIIAVIVICYYGTS